MLVGKWWLVPRASQSSEHLDSAGSNLIRSLGRVGLAFSAALLVALAGVLWRQMIEFRDPFTPLSEDLSLLLTATPWGTSWSAAVLTSVLALFGFALTGRWRRTGWVLATLGILPVAVFPARTGHANGVETFREFSLAADALHVLGAGLWLGGLVVLLFLVAKVRKSTPEDAPGTAVPALVDSFSHVARLGVFLLVSTGLFASWRHLPNLSALYSSGYGRTLLLKLLLVGIALSLGWWNWKRVTPRLSSSEGRTALSRFGTFEMVVAQVILLVTAILVRMSPTSGAM